MKKDELEKQIDEEVSKLEIDEYIDKVLILFENIKRHKNGKRSRRTKKLKKLDNLKI